MKRFLLPALQAIDPDIGNSEGLGVNLGDHQR